jgi:DNA-binding IclR family transcriptional regulator
VAVAAETSQTLDRGLRLLVMLAGEARGISVTDLAAALGTSRPAVYRMVASLERHGLVARSPDGGRVRLGLGVLSLARAVTPVVQEAATPVLRRLAEETRATAHLTVAEGARDAVAVAVVEPSTTDFHVAYRVGFRHPRDRGAAGRAILLGEAWRPGEDRAPGEGYVVSHGELQPGAVGVAAPVLGVPGLEASVGLVALGPSLDVDRAGPRVLVAAAAMAAALNPAS